MAQETIKLGVEGMSCRHCVMAVRNALTALPGVASAEVSLEQKLATVSYDPAIVGRSAMKTAIENAGYTVP
jgi:copper chaperone